MASLLQISEAIESGKIRMMNNSDENNGFDHANPADWLHKRAANIPDYVSLMRKCE